MIGELVRIKYIYFDNGISFTSNACTFERCFLLSNNSFLDLEDNNKLKYFIKDKYLDEEFVVEKI